jgi:hypothetical protein
VTITKSITISCQYTLGGALAAGNGIVINDSATATPNTAVVFLRGLDIFGVNPPSNGVRFISGASLTIEDSTIRRFNALNSFGVSFQPTGLSTLIISNTVISENGSGATGGGILVKPTGASGRAGVILRNVRVLNNANVGVVMDMTDATNVGGSGLVIDDTLIGRNGSGVRVLVPAGTSPTSTMIANSIISSNLNAGIANDGANATIRVGSSTITGNGLGVSPANGGLIRSYGDNRNDGNANDGAFSPGILPKE